MRSERAGHYKAAGDASQRESRTASGGGKGGALTTPAQHQDDPCPPHEPSASQNRPGVREPNDALLESWNQLQLPAARYPNDGLADLTP